ncbi:MAG: hypothetical protein GQ570_11895 [Helicobacteraceae bacterium]|nr:hypothetical protein [Helicobacteraceae bacterium]
MKALIKNFFKTDKESASLSIIKHIIRFSEKHGIKNARRLSERDNLSLEVQRKILTIMSRRDTIRFRRSIKRIMSS